MSKIVKQKDGKLLVPDTPTVPYITGDGVGAEITPAMQLIVDAAVEKVYGGKRKIDWVEVLAGEKAFNQTGSWLPDETMLAFEEYLVGIKGPLTTPVGGGIRSLNVALRQTFGFICVSSSGSLVPRGRFSGERAREGQHAHLSREHGRYICRHRVGGRFARSK